MDQGLYTAASGAMVMEERLSIIANNMANVTTTGFKKDAIVFEDFQKKLDTSKLSPGQYRATPVDVVIGRQYIDSMQGGFRDTGNPLDVAIAGEGFFAVGTPDGVMYTRDGAFSISQEGTLVTAQGYTVQGQGGDITIGKGSVSIDSRGTVMVDGNIIDMLQVSSIPEDGLVRQGNSLYSAREGSAPELVENPTIHQGHIESSNVDPVKEMVSLMTTQRAYESYQKLIKAFSDINGQTIRNVGTV